MTKESTEQEVSNGEMQTQKQEDGQEMTQDLKGKTKGAKTDKQFLDDLTTETPAREPDESGRIIVDGAFPQVRRKPVKDKTSNGLERVTY